MNISYKPPNFWRILIWSGRRLSQFSHLRNSRALVDLIGVCRKGIILQVIMTPSDLPVIEINH